MKPRTRTIERTRLVPHEIDGHTELVLDHYTVEVPVPPRDWDRAVRTAVTAIAGAICVASIIWSTASIGSLLHRTTVAGAAYSAAAVFDLVWLSCMALEWLARYDPARSQLPRRAGHAALGIAMGAVAAHGYLAGSVVIGGIGAAVSGLAKGLWTIVLAHYATPLDDRTQQWVDKRRAAVGGQLAMVSVRRELTRAQAAVAAEEAALRIHPDADPEESGSAPGNPGASTLPPAPGPMTITDAVRNAADSGIHDPEKVLSYVRQVADANAKLATVERYLRAFPKAAP